MTRWRNTDEMHGILPDISSQRRNVRESTSVPPEPESDDPFSHGHSKLYQRRREIEAELRREFNLPEEDLHTRETMPARGDGPLMFGRPPPVPKPRRNQGHLPLIPRPQVASEPPSRRRWGNIEEPSQFQSRPSEKEDQKRHDHRASPVQELERRAQQTAQQRQELYEGAQSSTNLSPGTAAWPAQDPPPPPPPMAAPLPQLERNPSVEKLGRDRPQSWRNIPSAEAQAAAQLGPAARLNALSNGQVPPVPTRNIEKVQEKARDLEDLSRGIREIRSNIQVPPGPVPPAANAEKVAQKARDLEDLSREFREKRKARETRKRSEETAQREAALAEEKLVKDDEREQQRMFYEQKAKEAREEEERFEKLRQSALSQQERDAEEAERRRKEQDSWEHEIRTRFKEEENQRKQQLLEEEERHRKARVQAELAAAERREQRQMRGRERENDRDAARKAEAERCRRHMEEEAEKFRLADAEFRAAHAEAERLKKNREHWPPPPPPPPRGRTFLRGAGGGPAPPSKPSRPSPSEFSRSASVPAAPDEVLRQAERAAMQQLRELERLPTKEEKTRAFKELLRAWHPDKNPQNVEVATAVFQRLQADRKKVLG